MPLQELEDIEYRKIEYQNRRRGPKPRKVRALIAATVWLDGAPHWVGGRVLWSRGEHQFRPDEGACSATRKALSALANQTTAARRIVPHFTDWYAMRRHQWAMAEQLLSLAAPDLESLVSPSRRRNPAALERLGQLLIAESYCENGLPASPSRALYEAWPVSKVVLERVANSEDLPLKARSIAWTTLCARDPYRALPGEKTLRRAARFGTENGMPYAPVLLALCLENDSTGVKNDLKRLEVVLTSKAPFCLRAEIVHDLIVAKKPLCQIVALAESAARLENPFPALRFVSTPKSRKDADIRRQHIATWNEIRQEFFDSMRAVLGKIALRGAPDDLEAMGLLMQRLITAPLSAAIEVNDCEERNVERHKKRKVSDFGLYARKATTKVLELLAEIAELPHCREVFILVAEASQIADAQSLAGQRTPEAWARCWKVWLFKQMKGSVEPLLKLSKDWGVDIARTAYKRDICRQVNHYHWPHREALEYALDLSRQVPISVLQNTFYWISNFWPLWENGTQARRVLAPIARLYETPSLPVRENWLDAIFSAVDISEQGARVDIPFAIQFLSAIRGFIPEGDTRFPLHAVFEAIVAVGCAGKEMQWPEFQMEEQTEWLIREVANYLTESDEKEVRLAQLSNLVWLAVRLTNDSATFQQLMKTGWVFADSNSRLDWSEVSVGVRLSKRFPLFQAALTSNFPSRPFRCLKLLEKLGLLDCIASARKPLEWWDNDELVAYEGAERTILIALDPAFEKLAARLMAINRLTGKAETLPSSVLKILDWPRKWPPKWKP